MTVAPFLAIKLAELEKDLAPTIPRVLSLADDEAIHDMRVGIRRVRTILKLARPVYGRFHGDAVRQSFAEIQRATGTLRDEEVLEELFGKLEVSDAIFIRWRTARKARERALRRVVLARLREGDLERASKLLIALVTLPVKPSRDADLAKFARRCVERARRQVEAQRDVPVDDSVGLHELRIAYKHLRYAAEILADALPADLAAMAKPASLFQKRLGEIHDADVAILSATRARGLPPVTRGRVLRALGELRQKNVGKYLEATRAGVTAPTPGSAGPGASEGGVVKSAAKKARSAQ